MILEIVLGFSIFLNIILTWYIYKLLLNMVDLTDGFEGMKTKLTGFATHLKAINKVESFYGDPSITALVEHMQRLGADIEEYTKLMIIYEDDLQEEIDEDDDNSADEEKA